MGATYDCKAMTGFAAVQVREELAAVEKADMNGQPIEDSFARVGYAKDAEYAINEQVK